MWQSGTGTPTVLDLHLIPREEACYHHLHFTNKKIKFRLAKSLAQAPQLGGRDQIDTQWSVNNSGRLNKESSLSSIASRSCEEVGLTPAHSEVKEVGYQLLSLLFRGWWKQRQKAGVGWGGMHYQALVLCQGLCQAFLHIIPFRWPCSPGN